LIDAFVPGKLQRTDLLPIDLKKRAEIQTLAQRNPKPFLQQIVLTGSKKR
jgi:hypothetical protein